MNHSGKALHGHHRSQWRHQQQKTDLSLGHIWSERGLVLKGEKKQSWTGPTSIAGSNLCAATVDQNMLQESNLITPHLSHPAVTWR